MLPGEFRAVRKRMGLSQSELASKLGVSRKSVSEWERGATIEKRTQLALHQLSRLYRSLHDYFKVEVAKDGRYLVVRSSLREQPREGAMAYFYGLTKLYGIFERRDHAYRWASALERCEEPRDTRMLTHERMLVRRAA